MYLPRTLWSQRFVLLLFALFLAIPTVQAFGLTNETITVWTDQSDRSAESAVTDSFFQLSGNLAPLDTVSPQYQVLNGTRAFNFMLSANGGAVELEITTATGQTNWHAQAGESVWGSGTLEGLNTLKITNTGATNANIELILFDVTAVDESWSGASTTTPSTIQVDFEQDGLYRFDMGLSSGRYQLLVNSAAIQRTVNATSAMELYVPAGRHELMIVPDSAGADWSLQISAVNASTSSQTLPYLQQGGALGGWNANFLIEELPLHLAAAQQVNISISATGDAADSLTLQVIHNGAIAKQIGPISGGETVWASMQLPMHSSIRVATDGENFQSLDYLIAIQAVPFLQPSYSWSGASHGAGLHSKLLIDLPVTGRYHVEVTAPEGLVALTFNNPSRTDSTVPVHAPNNFSYEFDIELDANVYELVLTQDETQPTTNWGIVMTLQTPSHPTIDHITPAEVMIASGSTIAIHGSEYMLPLVKLIKDGVATTVTDVTRVSATELQIEVPTTLGLGEYDIELQNNDGESVKATGILTITPRKIYVPIVIR